MMTTVSSIRGKIGLGISSLLFPFIIQLVDEMMQVNDHTQLVIIRSIRRQIGTILIDLEWPQLKKIAIWFN